MTKEQIHKELDYILSKEDPAKGNPRVKEVVNRLLKTFSMRWLISTSLPKKCGTLQTT